MNDQLYDDVTLERQITAKFGVHGDVDTVIARRFPVGRSLEATLYLTKKKVLMFYISGESPLLLSDVRKIVSRAGLQADIYLPPKGQSHYFEEVAQRKFNEIFPGRKAVNEHDLAFYKTLAPYSPALVMIKGVKDGVIYQFDSDARGGWRPHLKFSYRRIPTRV